MKRELGRVTLSDERPARNDAEREAADRALALLREEVDRLAAQRSEQATERDRGAPASPRRDDTARLEGAARFALRMGLVSPAEVREVFNEAGQRGLVQRGGHE